jgi:hypothetical protein
MSYLCSDLINSALRKIGVLAAGETPNSDENTDALQSVNALMEAWSAEQATIYQIVNFQGSLVATQQTYTIGTGGNFNTSRPLKIEKAGIITPDTLRHEIKIVGAKDWAEIEEKSLTGRLPKVLYNDNAFPLANLNIWPIPSGTGGAPTLDLYLWQQLQQFSAITDTFSMPPPYFRALVYALAIDLAPEYGSQAQAAAAGLADAAAKAKAEVIALNTSNAMGKEPSDLPPAPAPVQPQQ